jgi:hypothetical protein
MGKTTRISRIALYDLIWTEPIFKLSKQYGLSDVGFAKICKRNNIPRPPRGYWARIESGQKVARTPLPDRKDDRIIEIHYSTEGSKISKETDPFIKSSSISQLPKKIVVPEGLDEPHTLVAQAAEILGSSEPDTAGIVLPPKKGCLDIQVSTANTPRALRIMDTVIKTLQSIGHNVSITENGTLVTILDSVVNIRIREELVHRRLSAKDHNLNRYYEFGYRLFEEKLTPSGNLVLEIIDPRPSWERENRQRQWRDTESIPLEDSLRRFISGLIKTAAMWKATGLREQASNVTEPEIRNE